MGIISRLARQEGYDVVVDKQAVPYVRRDLDLTDRVITLYNQGGGGAPNESAGSGKKSGKAGKAKAPGAKKK